MRDKGLVLWVGEVSEEGWGQSQGRGGASTSQVQLFIAGAGPELVHLLGTVHCPPWVEQGVPIRLAM